MTEKLVIFNHFHLGDIHLSRTLVKKMSQHLKKTKNIEIFYTHPNGDGVIPDVGLAGVKYDRSFLSQVGVEPILLDKDGITYMNSWYGAGSHVFMNQNNGITFDALYHLFNYCCKNKYNFSLNDISNDPLDFFPDIDFSYMDTTNIDNWIAEHPEPKVIISNGTVLSGQADNFSFNYIVNRLAQTYPHLNFILTNDAGQPQHPNIFYSKTIINKVGFDLNENAYLSTKCNLIVGRSSGAFTYCFNKYNLFDRGQTFISISNLNYPGQYWLDKLGEQIIYKSKIINKNYSNLDQIYQLIVENLP